jgi:M6 family metalloprotease-like protein
VRILGASSFSYQVLADISAVNLVSGAATIAHEVGHNIGFPDLYDVSTTYPDFVTDFHPNLTWMGGWDMMASHGAFPHPGAYTKQSFHQWVSGGGDNGTVKTIMPGTDATYLVTPLELRRADYDVNIASGPNGEEVVKMLIQPGSSVVSTGFCADRPSGSTATATVISAGAGF